MERRFDEEGSLSSNGGSSISTDLFGIKDSTSVNSSKTSGIFSSVFQPQSTLSSPYSQAAGRDLLHSEPWGSLRKQGTGYPVGNLQQASKEGFAGSSGSESQSSIPIKGKNTGYLDAAADPCFFSSSLYYGGRDICSHSSNPRQSSTVSHTFKEGEEDDPNSGNPNSASRGNWWQGSLYY